MKAIRSNKRISPHGGIVPILYKINELGVPHVIRECLKSKKRAKQAKYGYHEALISWVLTSFCGGTRLAHISKVRKKLSIIPAIKLPSHDTLGRMMKALADETKTHRSISRDAAAKINFTDYDDNLLLNEMLVKASKQVGAIKEGRKYTADIDATFVATECRGALRTKNKEGKVDLKRIGFYPMIFMIGDLPLCISMRSGNAGSRFQVPKFLANAINILENSNIQIGRVRSDAAGYSKEAFEFLDNKGIMFNVRFHYQKMMLTFKGELEKCTTWRKTLIETANHFWECDIADIPYKMFDHPSENRTSKTWRVVALRKPTLETLKKTNKDEYEREIAKIKRIQALSNKNALKEEGKNYGDNHWTEIDGYLYKFFITNDYTTSSEEIVDEFNKRGGAERKFSFLKKDFAWRLPPFMQMNENTVFMIVAALANNVYRAMLQLFHQTIRQLRLNMRLHEFQFIFIDVACSYSKKRYIFYNTEVAYELLI